MSQGIVRLEGATFLTIEAISACYDCEVTWMYQAYEFGLLGRGRMHSGLLVFNATVLDRVAEVVRLGRYQGLGFEAIVVLLGDPASESVD